MLKIVPVVEGDGELRAVPTLIQKVLGFINEAGFFPAHPKNAHGRGNLTKDGGIEQFVSYALTERDCGGVLVILDGDGDCAKDLACDLAKRVSALSPRRPVAIVVANRNYENWFVAGIDSITATPIEERPRLSTPTERPADPDSLPGAKAWLSRLMRKGRIYKETIDQHPMTQLLDIASVHTSSRSFRRLVHAVRELVQAASGDTTIVSPVCLGPETPHHRIA